jgi:hypothetical protein
MEVNGTSSLSQGYENAGGQDQFIVGGNIVSIRGSGLSGNATIAAGNTSVTVNHSLGNGLTPKVLLQPVQKMGSLNWWVSGKSATQFTINISQASAGSALSFDWIVVP